MKIIKVISGGQTGADRLGLEVARQLNIATGGTAPKGFRTENGPDLSLQTEFGLVEHESPSWGPRTEQNVIDSDATIVLGDITSAGSKLTLELAKKHKKPWICNPPTSDILLEWLVKNDVEILNVAGNRGSKFEKYYNHFEKLLKNTIITYNG